MIIETKMYKLSCCECGVIYCVTDDFRESLLSSGNNFYCPNGHRQCYSKSYKTKYQEEKLSGEKYLELANEKDRQCKKLKKQIQGYKGHAAKLKIKLGIK